ncbi:MAG: type II toxin-antitoxin system RelE/ParE family toxin [Cyclobacteriaceae bacterium]|nr:type II toxin-antitoxin system RelE/ParE family toxin [Cyclobacteriaceae bacterium]
MVKKAKPVVVWSNSASHYFRKAYDYIHKESEPNAQKVRAGIIRTIDELVDNPERHPPDKFKKNNSGNYRAFEKFSFRITYKLSETEILILRVRHVKQEPKEY